MNQNLTEIVFILDRSGSMSHLVNDTIGGFNSFVEEQKKQDGEALLTTILFDDQYDVLHSGKDIKTVELLTNKEYFVRGGTALLDAIAKSINEVGARLNNTNEEDRPAKVLFVITTDGEENASKEFTRQQVKEMIEHQQEKYGWSFLFMGANMDAVSTAQSYGISGNNSVTYTASSIGTRSIYTSLNSTISAYRSNGVVDSEWSKDVK